MVVPVVDRADSIRLSLDALSRQTVADQLEIIVVDDASSDGTPAVVEQWIHEHPSAPVRLHRRTRRGGPNASRNDGIRLARADTILLCDGDDIAHEDWAAELLRVLEQDARPGRLVGGACVELGPDGRLTDTIVIGPLRCGWLPYAPGGNCAFLRSTAIAVEGFDERIRTGGTEIDFALRVHDAIGLDVVHVPSARTGYSLPAGTWRRLRRRFLRGRGHAYLGRRHGGRIGFTRVGGVIVYPWRNVVADLDRMVRGGQEPIAVAEQVAEALGLAWWTLVRRVWMPPPRPGLPDSALSASQIGDVEEP